MDGDVIDHPGVGSCQSVQGRRSLITCSEMENCSE